MATKAAKEAAYKAYQAEQNRLDQTGLATMARGMSAGKDMSQPRDYANMSLSGVAPADVPFQDMSSMGQIQRAPQRGLMAGQVEGSPQRPGLNLPGLMDMASYQPEKQKRGEYKMPVVSKYLAGLMGG